MRIISAIMNVLGCQLVAFLKLSTVRVATCNIYITCEMLLNVEKNRKNGRKNLVKKKKNVPKKFEKKNLGKKKFG